MPYGQPTNEPHAEAQIFAQIPVSRPIRLSAGAAFIATCCCLLYYPALGGGLIFDDHAHLTDSGLVQAPDGLYRFWCTTESQDYWPLTNTTFWLEWRLWGMNGTGYRITNLLLHIVAALLLWATLRKLRIPGAFLAALLFAVHPVNVQSVAWIAQRKNTLAMVFFLLSILWYLQSEQERETRGEGPDQTGWLWYVLSLLAFVFAMLSKGSVAIVPILLLAIVWWNRKRITPLDLARTGPFFFVAIGLTSVNVWFQSHGSLPAFRSVSFSQRLAGAGAAVWFYLSKALVPIRLVFIYPQWRIQTGDWLWWLPLVAALIVTILMLRKGSLPESQWGRSLLFAWFVFCVALLPVMGFTDTGFMQYTLVGNHYEHIAIVAVVASEAAALTLWRAAAGDSSRSASFVTFILMASLMLQTYRQCRLYGDNIELYRDTLNNDPGCWLAHNDLGVLLAGTGKLTEAIEQYQKTIAIRPDYTEAYNNLGIALAKEGRRDEAIETFQAAFRVDPDYIDAHFNFGNLLADSGRLQEAIEQYLETVRLAPFHSQARGNLAIALAKSGRDQEAIQQFELLLNQDPSQPKVHYNLALTLAHQGKLREAIEHFEQALRLQPDYAQACASLAQAYAGAGRYDEARSMAEKACELARAQGHPHLAAQVEAWLKSAIPAQTNRLDAPGPGTDRSSP